MNNNFSVSIVIPNFNGEELLKINLPIIKKVMENPVNKISEVIIVDDGSKDGSIEFIRNNYPKIILVCYKKNRGFSSAVNVGIKLSKGNLIVLLNNDVKPQENFLGGIFKYFSDKRLFAVSFHEKGYGWAWGKFQDGFIIYEPGKESKEYHSTFWVSGGSGIFRREILFKLGLFDERLFSPFYWEDLDLSYRALKHGYKILWIPEAEVVHNHESTVKQISENYRWRIQERNQLLFIWKNISSKNMLKKHFLGLFSRITKHPGYFLIFLMAISKLLYIIRVRKKLAREERVSDEAIFASFK